MQRGKNEHDFNNSRKKLCRQAIWLEWIDDADMQHSQQMIYIASLQYFSFLFSEFLVQ